MMNWRQLRNLPTALVLKSPLHPVMSGSVLLITVRGRKTGRSYTLPANYVSNRGELLVISRPERTWWRNLVGGAQVHLRLEGGDYAAQGVVLTEPDEKQAAFLTMIRTSPHFARHLGLVLNHAGMPADPDVAANRIADLILIRLYRLRANNSTPLSSKRNGPTPNAGDGMAART